MCQQFSNGICIRNSDCGSALLTISLLPSLNLRALYKSGSCCLLIQNILTRPRLTTCPQATFAVSQGHGLEHAIFMLLAVSADDSACLASAGIPPSQWRAGTCMTDSSILDLEDLARRYDPQMHTSGKPEPERAIQIWIMLPLDPKHPYQATADHLPSGNLRGFPRPRLGACDFYATRSWCR